MDTISVAPVDIIALIEKAGTLGVISFFCIKIIWNDMVHIRTQLEGINKSLGLLIRLQAESMGKNPDLIEAQNMTQPTPDINLTS